MLGARVWIGGGCTLVVGVRDKTLEILNTR